MNAAPSSNSPITPMPPSPWSGAAGNPHRMNAWPLLIGGGRVLGIFLIFLGTLIAVVLASPPGSCFTVPSTCSGYASLAANSLIAAKALWAFGLVFLAATSGIRLQGGLMPGGGLGPEPGPGWAFRYVANLVVLVLSIALLWYLLGFTFAIPATTP